MVAGTSALRFIRSGLRLLQLCAASIILGPFWFFLVILANHEMAAQDWLKAVAGISTAAAVYYLLPCAIPSSVKNTPFYARLLVVLDACFAVGFLAICIMTRHGVQSCSGHVVTPIGDGEAQDAATGFGGDEYGSGREKTLHDMLSLKTACLTEKTAFAASVIGIGLFLASIPVEISYRKRAKNSKDFTVPPPQEGISIGKRKRFWPFRVSRASAKDAETNYSQEFSSSAGAIPLHNRQPEEKLPGHATSIFQHLSRKAGGNNNTESTSLQPANQRPNRSSNLFNHGFGYANNTYPASTLRPSTLPTHVDDQNNPWRAG